MLSKDVFYFAYKYFKIYTKNKFYLIFEVHKKVQRERCVLGDKEA
jgi:hypothetical protein